MKVSPLLRRLSAFALAVTLTIPSVYASAGETKLQTNRSIADGLEFLNTVSIHPTAGRVESFTLELDPDQDVYPILVQGSGTIYSGASINKAVALAQSHGYHVLGAINTDFFSYATGVPMGLVVEDGVYKSSPEGRPALTITDGAFELVEEPKITLTLTNETTGEQVTLTHLNKWRTSTGGLYLLNEHFSSVSTRTSTSGWMVRMQELDGEELAINGELELEVTELIRGSDAVSIGEGNYILTADDQSGLGAVFQQFQQGDRITLRAESDTDGLEQAQWACGVGDVMVREGELTDSSRWEYTKKGRDPRTALGVRRDGTVVMYVADGRKTGYSAGLTQVDLAEEMLERGCEWAVNLDGGGSSAMSVWIHGLTGPEIVNIPSDGAARSCATYLLLVTDESGDGRPDRLALKNDGLVVLTGTSVNLGEAVVLDDGLNPLPEETEELDDLTIRSQEDLGEVEDNIYTAGDKAGTDTLKLSSRDLHIKGTAQIHVVDELTELTITKEGSSTPLTSISLKSGEQLALSAQGSYYGRLAMRDLSGVTWSVEGGVGTVDENGVFTADASAGSSGSITAQAGGLSVTIPVTPTALHLDVDESHWAYSAVEYCYENALVSGISTTEFGPTYNIRRGDFLLMLYRAAGSPAVRSTVTFPDVSPTDYYADAIAWAQENGLASGMEDGTFAPNQNVTREQAFTMLNRFLPMIGIQCSSVSTAILDQFADRSSISSWAESHAATLVAYQIVGGSDGRLNPGGNLSRAEMAALLYKLGNYDPSVVTPILPEEPDEPVSPDVPETPVSFQRAGVPGSVNADVEKLNVRTGPGSGFEVAAQIVGSTPVLVLDNDGSGWLHVQYFTAENTFAVGYVSAQYVTVQNGVSGTVHTDVENLNVRTGPGTDHEVADRLPGSTPVFVLEQLDSGWLHIQYLLADGTFASGYVSAQYVSVQA